MKVSIENLTKSYNNKKILNEVSLSLKGGDIIGLLGKNGAGKSTFINCLIDIVEPDSGKIIFNETVLISSDSKLKKRIGIQSEVIAPILEFTGNEYLKYISLVYELDEITFRERKQKLTEFFFKDVDILDKAIAIYSTGMKKIISFCAAVINQPDLLILDEPFSSLDIIAIQKILIFLKNFTKNDRIILIASHDLSYLEKIVNRIAVLDDKQIKYDNSLSNFIENGDIIISDALYKVLNYKNEPMEWL